MISALTFVWFFIWSVANFADANGFVKIGDYFNSGYKVAGGFAVIESILCFGVSILTVLNAFLFSRKWYYVEVYLYQSTVLSII
mgnify:CR=1 FL=1